jgi:hypothetical protein
MSLSLVVEDDLDVERCYNAGWKGARRIVYEGVAGAGTLRLLREQSSYCSTSCRRALTGKK